MVWCSAKAGCDATACSERCMCAVLQMDQSVLLLVSCAPSSIPVHCRREQCKVVHREFVRARSGSGVQCASSLHSAALRSEAEWA